MIGQRHALVLSGSIGQGHDVLAQACSGWLESQGWSTQVLDVMRLLGTRGGSVGGAVFRTMLAAPGLYDAYYFAMLRTGNGLAALTDRAARRQVVPRLRGHLAAQPPDLVLSAFATAASAVSELAGTGHYPGMRHVVFCTDATPHRLWVHAHVDLYLVTSAVAEQAIRRFQPDARVVVVPPPLRAEFYDPPPASEARRRLGLPEHERCVTLMSGAWGIGPLAQTALALAEARINVLAVAGRNGRLEHQLTAIASKQPRIRSFGYTDQVAELMAASDLVITSSGGGTCAEARTIGRPMVLLDVLQGHGRDNVQHELELGDAAVASGRPAEVVKVTMSMLEQSKPPPPIPTRRPAAWQGALASALESIGL